MVNQPRPGFAFLAFQTFRHSDMRTFRRSFTSLKTNFFVRGSGHPLTQNYVTRCLSCKIIYLETGLMRDESTKQAAQEYLAAKLTEEEQAYEAKLNGETAVARSPMVWKRVKDAIFAQCSEWN